MSEYRDEPWYEVEDCQHCGAEASELEWSESEEVLICAQCGGPQ